MYLPLCKLTDTPFHIQEDDISSTFILYIAGAVQYPFNTWEWMVLPRVSLWYTLYVSLPTQFRFNVGPASQLIAGSMSVNRLRRWPNTNSTLGLLYTLRQHISKHMAFTQCCFNVDPHFSMLVQHWTCWNSIGWLSRVCWALRQLLIGVYPAKKT